MRYLSNNKSKFILFEKNEDFAEFRESPFEVSEDKILLQDLQDSDSEEEVNISAFTQSTDGSILIIGQENGAIKFLDTVKREIMFANSRLKVHDEVIDLGRIYIT